MTKFQEKAKRPVNLALGILGLVFFAAAVVSWFTGAHRFRVLGVKISLDNWLKPWWIGTALWALRATLADRPAWATRLLSGLTRRGSAAIGLPLIAPERGWTAWGMVLGTGAGFLAAIHYYYLFPRLGLQIILTLVAAAVVAGAHWLFFVGTDAMYRRLFPAITAERRASFREGLYLILWSVLISWPLRAWEARLTEPIQIQGLEALGVGLLLTWLVLAEWRRPGILGRAHRVAAVAAIAILAVLSLISWRAEAGRENPSAPPRDRVILITLDTTRADHLSCYGYPRPTSPNLDALAASGARFTRAFCTMGTTDPSHASMLTGTYPRTHGLQSFHQRITGQVSSLAEAFRDQGYATAAITSREALLPTDMGVPGFTDMSGPAGYAIQTSAPEAYRRAANWLTRHRHENVFMWIHLFDPHHPYEPHPGYSEPFLPVNKGARSGNSFLEPGERYTDEEIKYRIDLYDGEIAYMDAWLGKIVAFARKLSPAPARPALIVAMADHGEAMGEYQDRPIHYGFGHGGVLYNGVTHVPLIISWPGQVPSGRVVSDITISVSLAPTLLDYALGKTDFPAQRESLRAVIESRPAPVQEAVIQRFQIRDNFRPDLALPQFAIVAGNRKLFINSAGSAELYELGVDWLEVGNLAEKSPDLVKALTARWMEWMKTTPAAKPEERELSPAEINRLRALGYVK